jgi:hypothetical protein
MAIESSDHPSTVELTNSALFQRTKRCLAKDRRALKRARPAARVDLGSFYVVDLRTNRVAQTHVDLMALARELGLVQPWEGVP